MKVLLDTHTLLWSVDDPSRLSTSAYATLQDPANDLIVSVATLWELAIKVGLRKLTLSPSYRRWIDQALNDLTASVLPITIEAADLISGLPQHHRDPFDRLLIAQSLLEGLVLVSADTRFDAYGVNRLW